MSVCCCPQYQAVTWVMYVASARAGHGGQCPGRDPPGFLLWKGLCCIQRPLQALLPSLPWHLQPVGAPQGLHRSCRPPQPSWESGMGVSLLSLGHFAPRRTHRETPAPASHSQLLAPSPGCSWWSCCLSQPPPVPAAGALPLKGDGAKSQSNGKQQDGAGEELMLLFWAEDKLPSMGTLGTPSQGTATSTAL